MALSPTDLFPSLALERHLHIEVWYNYSWQICDMEEKIVPVIKDEIERVHFGSGTCYRKSPARTAATGSFYCVFIYILHCCPEINADWKLS